MLQDLALGPDTVDVSMETLASAWVHDPCDLSDLREKGLQPSSVWGSQCVLNSSPPAGRMWAEQLSPHLQRNKQLQDTLLQREEELARLQEENNKLREFLNSSFVRNLEQKAKRITADGRRNLKRNMLHLDETSQQVSKRVCRNLTAKFCSESSEMSSSEPNLDLWVFRTLGLKDRDTIDTSTASSSSPGYSLRSLVYDDAVASSSSSESTFSSSFSSSLATSTSSSVHSYVQRSIHQSDYGYSAAQRQEANCNPAMSQQHCTAAPGQHCDLTATGLSRSCDAPDAVIRSHSTSTVLQSPTEDAAYSQVQERAEICSITTPIQVQTLTENQAKHPACWSSLGGGRAPSQDNIQFSTSEEVPFSHISSSSPAMNQLWTPVSSRSPVILSAGSQPPATLQMPRSRTDLAFSMSLSPSSSVKTHSFPQGQAFVRKDPEGRWSFTWVPRQGP